MQQYSFEDLKNIMRGRKHFEEFKFPGEDEIRIAVRVLTSQEIEDTQYKAEIIVKRKYPEIKTEDLKSSIPFIKELERQILFNAIVKVPLQDSVSGEFVFDKFFNSVDEIGLIEQSRIESLFEYYHLVQEKYSPHMTIKNEGDFENLIEEIKKNSIVGLSLSTPVLQMLLDFLVKNPTILLKDSGLLSQPSKQGKESLKKKPQNLVKVEKISEIE